MEKRVISKAAPLDLGSFYGSSSNVGAKQHLFPCNWDHIVVIWKCRPTSSQSPEEKEKKAHV